MSRPELISAYASPLTDAELETFLKLMVRFSTTERGVRYAFSAVMSERVMQASQDWRAA